MEGNPVSKPTDEAMDYAIRITFGIVHAVLLTLFSFGLAFLVPSFSHFLFALYGCILAPAISLALTIFCNACVQYVSQSIVTVADSVRTAWIPPLGVFCVSLLILPLEMMPSLAYLGPLNTLVATSILANFFVTLLLQVYAARRIQSSSSELPAGSSGPI